MELSIIVPVFNVLRFFPRFGDSVSVHLHEHEDIELILVNDGSTDGSGELLKSYAAKHPRVKVIHQENQGVSAARNAGLDCARGRYIAFADPDDWLDDSYVAAIKNAISADDLDIAIFAFQSHVKSGVMDKRARPLPVVPISGVEYMSRQLRKYREIERPSWNKAYKAEFLHRINARFPIGVRLAEDMIFNIHVFYMAKKVRAFKAVIYHYNKLNNESVTACLRDDPVFSVNQRVILSREIRGVVASWSSSLWVKRQLLGFSYRESLRTSVDRIAGIESRRERRNTAQELLSELNNYSLKDIYLFLTITDFRLWLRLHRYTFVAHQIYRNWVSQRTTFRGSDDYWQQRYESGGNSGHGSYSHFAEFKAEVLNDFFAENNVRSVIDYGCGDGNQLSLVLFPEYLGFDISDRAIGLCKKKFDGDASKQFMRMSRYNNEKAELTMSLDVIYHLVEDPVYSAYMHRLFDSAERFVVIYSSNTDENSKNQAPHVHHREFSKWVSEHKNEWVLLKHIPNKYPYNGDAKTGSFSDFFLYAKT